MDACPRKPGSEKAEPAEKQWTDFNGRFPDRQPKEAKRHLYATIASIAGSRFALNSANVGGV